MAATKIFPITSTEAKALAYIASPEKTDHGRLIFTSGCSENPYQASRDFAEVRANGTGLNTVLSQHFIQSFSPGEITPERALEIGKELCEKFLKGEYQYFLAVHTDKNHVHLHCIFNNVNMYDGLLKHTRTGERLKKTAHFRNSVISPMKSANGIIFPLFSIQKPQRVKAIGNGK